MFPSYFILLMFYTASLQATAHVISNSTTATTTTTSKPQSTNNSGSEQKLTDHLAQEQRLAVQIITTDLGDESHSNSHQSRMASQSSSDVNLNEIISFDDQYRMVESQLSNLASDGPPPQARSEKLVANKGTHGGPQSGMVAMPKRIVINLGQLMSNNNHSQQATKTSTTQKGTKVTIGLVQPHDQSPSRLPLASGGQPARNPRPSGSSNKRSESQLAANSTAADRGRQSFVSEVQRQGGIPTMIVDNQDQAISLQGEMEATGPSGRWPARPAKLMLNSELVDRMQRQAQSKKSFGLESDIDDVSRDVRSLESEILDVNSGKNIDSNSDTTSARRHSRELTNYSPKNTSITTTTPRLNYPKLNSDHSKATMTTATKNLLTKGSRVSSSGGQVQRRNKQAPIIDQPSFGSRVNNGQRDLAHEPNAFNSKADDIETEARIDNGVANLLQRLKLYTTKDSLMKVARDLENNSDTAEGDTGPGQGLASAGQPQPQHQHQTNGLDMLTDSQNPMEPRLDIIDGSGEGAQVPGRDSTATVLELGYETDLRNMPSLLDVQGSRHSVVARSRVPAPIKYEMSSTDGESPNEDRNRLLLPGGGGGGSEDKDLDIEGSERFRPHGDGLEQRPDMSGGDVGDGQAQTNDRADMPDSSSENVDDREESGADSGNGPNNNNNNNSMATSDNSETADHDGTPEETTSYFDEEIPHSDDNNAGSSREESDKQQQQQQSFDDNNVDYHEDGDRQESSYQEVRLPSRDDEEIRALEAVIDELIAREREEKEELTRLQSN